MYFGNVKSFFTVMSVLFFVIFGNASGQTGKLERELLPIDDKTVFSVYFDNSVIAKSVTGELKPVRVNKKTLPVIHKEENVCYIHMKTGRALGYKSAGWFPSEKGTIEALVRYRPFKGIENMSNRDHIFTLFKNNNERIYLRFYGLATIHYLFRNGRPIRQKHIHIKSSLVDNNRWCHIALQWDFSDVKNGKVQLYLDGRCISEYGRISISPIKVDENTIFWIGSYAVGQFPADDFDIRAVRVSKGLRFSGKTVRKIVYSIESQEYSCIKALLSDLSAKKAFLREEEGRVLSEFRKELGVCEKNFSNSGINDDIRGILLSRVKEMSKKIKTIAENVNARIWDEKNKKKTKLACQEFSVFCEGSMRKISEDRKSYVPAKQEGMKICMARNERESFQIIVVPKNSGESVLLKVSACDLRSSEGKTIRAENIKIYRVRSIADIYADPLFPVRNVEEISYPKIACFWITVYVPVGTSAGVYKGAIELTSVRSSFKVSVPYELKVWNFALPVQPALKTAFGLSPEFIELRTAGMAGKNIDELKDAYVKYMLEHRTSPKSYLRFTLETKNSADNKLAEKSRVKQVAIESNRDFFHPRQILKKDGRVVLDFSGFDELVERYIPLGLNAFVAGNRFWDAQNTARRCKPGEYGKLKHKFWVYDEREGKYRTLYLNVLSDDYVRVMKSVFSQWQEHLEKKGWLDMAYGYIVDEPTNEMFGLVSKLYGIAKQAAPKIPLLLTHKPAKGINNVDIWCIQLCWYSEQQVGEELNKGRHLWFYVCIGPERPYGNFFLYQEPIEHRILFWQTYKYHGEGFLYWEINYWSEGNPLDYLKGGITFDKNMDGKLVYPGTNGPIGSIRYENIRDGIEDYDYLILLKKAYQSGRFTGKAKLRVNEILKVPSKLVASPRKFSHNADILLRLRREIGELLDRTNVVE